MEKTLILALITMATIQPIHAAEPTMCEMMGNIAEVAMSARQHGQTMSAMMKKMKDPNDPGNDLIVQMIIAAYEQPVFNTPDNQQKAIVGFRNDMELICYKARPDGNNLATE